MSGRLRAGEEVYCNINLNELSNLKNQYGLKVKGWERGVL